MTSRLPLKSHCQRADIDAGAAELCQHFLAVVCWQHRADFVVIRQLGQADQSTILRRVPNRRYRRATAVSGHARVLRKRGSPEQKAAGGCCPESFATSRGIWHPYSRCHSHPGEGRQTPRTLQTSHRWPTAIGLLAPGELDVERFRVHRYTQRHEGASCHKINGASKGTNAPLCWGTSRGV
jgi:hypothetical protein